METQAGFADKNDLDFTLLSDPKGKVGKVFGTKRKGVKFQRRATFVIDTDKTLLGKYSSETDFTEHADSALETLRAELAD